MFKHPIKNTSQAPEVLQQITHTLRLQKKLTQQVQSILPAELAKHCLHVTSNNKNIVTLYTDSSVWASKLLYLRRSIMTFLSQQFCDPVKNIKVKVLPQPYKSIPKKIKKPALSVINNLQSTLSSQEHNKLNDAMYRLIETLKKSP